MRIILKILGLTRTIIEHKSTKVGHTILGHDRTIIEHKSTKIVYWRTIIEDNTGTQSTRERERERKIAFVECEFVVRSRIKHE